MDENNQNDIQISGSGKSSGGTYRKITISGSGEISGDIKCESLKISGSGHLKGSLSAKGAVISGSAKIDGDTDCEGEFKINGSAKFAGRVKSVFLRIFGESHFGDSLEAETVSLSGSANIAGDCSADSFTVNGAVNIGGLLNADKIELKLHPFGSSIKSIGCGTINVYENPSAFLKHLFHAISPLTGFILKTGTIEGDDISLCKTQAETVRGKNVKIGRGCKIDLVEYTGNYEKAADAQIGREMKV